MYENNRPASKAKRHDSPEKFFMLLGAFLIVHNLRDDRLSLYIDFHSYQNTNSGNLLSVMTGPFNVRRDNGRKKLDRL